MRSRTARLAIALLVGVAGWATGGPYGQGQSAGRRTTSPEAATAFGWRLPDWMPPPPVPPDNPMSAAKVELGRSLFFDARLAGLNYISCATCHRPEIGFSDGRPVAIGVTGERHPRNSQSLANVGYLPALTWADPGVTSLEEQSKLPLFGQHPVEMLSTGREAGIVARLGTDLRYVRLFSEAFPETEGRIDFVAIRRALAAFQRTLLSFGSPYDRYRHAGEADAISAAAKRGEKLFFGDRLACGRCHPAPFFTDAVGPARYHNTGLYNLDGEGALPAGNQGLIEHTGKPEDMGRFRTPSLRNIAVTAPYMHDGSMRTLGEVIEHYAGGGRSALEGKRSPLTSPLITGFAIADGEKADLIAFLEALTDRSFLENPENQSPFR
jgi:cytochrome c peroxidase